MMTTALVALVVLLFVVVVRGIPLGIPLGSSLPGVPLGWALGFPGGATWGYGGFPCVVPWVLSPGMLFLEWSIFEVPL